MKIEVNHKGNTLSIEEVNEDTGEILETIREYYERGGEFINIPDKYPCVIYFPFDNVDSYDKLKWIYIGEE